MFVRATITLGIGPHSSFVCFNKLFYLKTVIVYQLAHTTLSRSSDIFGAVDSIRFGLIEYVLAFYAMVALWNRADHCIFILWFFLSFFVA